MGAGAGIRCRHRSIIFVFDFQYQRLSNTVNNIDNSPIDRYAEQMHRHASTDADAFLAGEGV